MRTWFFGLLVATRGIGDGKVTRQFGLRGIITIELVLSPLENSAKLTESMMLAALEAIRNLLGGAPRPCRCQEWEVSYPTALRVIGQPGTTAPIFLLWLFPLQRQRCAIRPDSIFNSSIVLHPRSCPPSPSPIEPDPRISKEAGDLLSCRPTRTIKRYRLHDTSAKMSYVTRRALSTLIPPKVCSNLRIWWSKRFR
jgi:hypothetical protein